MNDNNALYPILSRVDTPHDLRTLPVEDLPALADELRLYLINSLNQCGGHFAGSLGTVELTIALHYVFNTPDDKLVWDVGHQAYGHKVLTGRRDRLNTIKQYQGLSPFPKRSESEYDTFGVGHSSTSISAALGMAIASKIAGSPNQGVAIIGDGGLTGGMAFEALNHAGSVDANLLIILNDNDMSISHNVGALTNYLTRILTGKTYTSFRENSKKVLNMMPPMKTLVKRTETHLKGMITPGTLFEELGIHYFGPIDGHDLDSLIPTLRNIHELTGPRLLHVVTTKGKGYEAAETDPIKYHAVKPGFHKTENKADDQLKESTLSTNFSSTIPVENLTNKRFTYSDIFGQFLCDIAHDDKRLYAITPAMREGSGMVEFHQRFPEQYCDVGIAEQHSVTLAAGLACEGLKPVVAIYSTFLQRAYDQLIHDVALQNLDVTFAIDRAGLVGPDGPTHAGSFDLSFLRCIPNMIIMAPSNENECRQMLYTAYQYPGPAAVRYPRGSGTGAPIQFTMTMLEVGKSETLLHGEKIAILAFGSMVTPSLTAGKELNATVVNMRFVKPLDEETILQIAKTHSLIVTVEENAVMGGAGSAINEFLAAENMKISILNLGLPDTFIEHGDPDLLLANCGLNAEGILSAIQEREAKIKNTVFFD
ncbi:MAG: 1-deoxy-D-xylulose-5-phosphate synthase [Gammaproteobacteria bacterium]|nr:1-deoxy-D-xylulose-5-phosphate synthase [Gammaproteobacteria bacterium]